MVHAEASVWKQACLKIGKTRPLARLWRNNVGQAWMGRGFNLKRGQTYRAEGGERVIMDARPVDFGLCKGSGDGIGFDSIVVTPDMVGRRVAVFLSIETKSKAGRATKEQINWQKLVHEFGGIALIVSDADQIKLI